MSTFQHPRRVVPPSPPGSLLKRPEGQPRDERPSDAGRDPDYLAMVRLCPCLKCGMEPSEAAHVRYASAAHGKASGLGKKPEDRWALPLCADCHRLSRDAQHNRGEYQFWCALGINPLATAERLYAQRGDQAAMFAVIFTTIAGRGFS